MISKGDDIMKCSKCGNKTTWNKSYGVKHNLICPKCFDKLVKQNNNNVMKTLKEIFKKTIDKS